MAHFYFASDTYTGWNKAGVLMAEKANALYMKATGTDEPLTYIRPNHDWRVTMATKLTEMGYSAELADRILGHLRPSMERTYNKYAHLDERRKALEDWEEYVLSLNQRKTPKQIKEAQLKAMWADPNARYWASEANIDPLIQAEHKEAIEKNFRLVLGYPNGGKQFGGSDPKINQ